MTKMLCLVLCLCAGPLFAQSDPPQRNKNLTLLGIPSATTAPAGIGFVGLSVAGDEDQRLDRYGSLAFGFGLGNAQRNLGAQITAQTIAFGGDTGESGQISVKLSRQIGQGRMPLFLAAQTDYLLSWGDADETDPRAKLILTGFRALNAPNGQIYPVMFSIGAGNDLRNDGTDPGLFLGAGVGLTPALGTSLAWTGESFTLGLALRAPSRPELSLSLAAEDIFDQQDKGRLALSASWIFNLKRGR
ncbi:hypothetical protein [Actibacterium ureilyticum]|uniref:hypothetical protein n=1 Tax=Actibacterium ureilyticum TaxID=1590614 RepID=UPI000BAAF070|nr:hypothetical protein [Actibacterium ureilyticum]